MCAAWCQAHSKCRIIVRWINELSRAKLTQHLVRCKYQSILARLSIYTNSFHCNYFYYLLPFFGFNSLLWIYRMLGLLFWSVKSPFPTLNQRVRHPIKWTGDLYLLIRNQLAFQVGSVILITRYHSHNPLIYPRSIVQTLHLKSAMMMG